MASWTRRWLAIVICLGIPTAVVVAAGFAPDPPRNTDPSFPAECEAIHAQVETGAGDKAIEAIRTVVASETASVEERQCAESAYALVAGPDGKAKDEPPTKEQLLGTLPPPCTDAATAAQQGDIDLAVARYKAIQNEADASPEGRACAVGGLARLAATTTPLDWTFTQANRVVDRLTRWLPGGPLTLDPSSTNTVVAVVWFLTAGLVFIALRQFLRWRRDRQPGPVKINAITGLSAETDTAALAEVMRDRLAEAGVYPNPLGSGVGELVVDVSEVLTSAGETGWLGKAFAALKDALAVTTGYVVTATPDHDKSDKGNECRLTAQLDEAATGRTVSIKTYSAAAYRETAILAAYEIYLQLANLPEVARRTPPWLRWSDVEALRGYHQALEDNKKGSHLTAHDHLADAALKEPANQLIQLELARTCLSLAQGTLKDKALDPDFDDGKYYIEAIRASARAVCLNTDSEESLSHLGWALGCVSQWHQAWDNGDDELQALLAKVGIEGIPPAPKAPGGQADFTEFDRALVEHADRFWRKGLHRSRWLSVLRIAWRLDRRRTVSGQVWLFRRRRKSIQDLDLAAATGSRYDRFRADCPSGTRFWTWFRLQEVRFGRAWGLRRTASLENTVRYNLAAAYARRAVWQEKAASADADKSFGAAVHWLDKAYSGPQTSLTRDDLDFVLVDPDFEELRKKPVFTDWRRRYLADVEVTLEDSAWRETFSRLAEKAEAAREIWVDHLMTPIPRSGSWTDATSKWCASTLEWLGDDFDRWSKLHDWATNAAATAKQTAFSDSIGTPVLNKGRGVPMTVAPVPLAPATGPARWAVLAAPTEDAMKGLGHFISVITSEVEAQNASAVRALFETIGPTCAAAWNELALWARTPDSPFPW